MEGVTILLLLRAFASGSVALTGTEAIANGVPAFQPPGATERRGHAVGHGGPAGGAVRRHHLRRRRLRHRAHRGHDGHRRRGAPRCTATARSASTCSRRSRRSSSSWPRTRRTTRSRGWPPSWRRTDSCPRHFAFRGDRLAYTVGILLLSGIAIALIVLFDGDTHALIPLYSVGVFVSFTLSQSGMVRHWLRLRPARAGAGGRRSTPLGAMLTGVVLVVVLVAKAPAVAPGRGHHPGPRGHDAVHRAPVPTTASRSWRCRPTLGSRSHVARSTSSIPVPGLNRAVVQAVQFGRSLADDVVVVHVTEDVRRRRAAAGPLRAAPAGRALRDRGVAVPLAGPTVRALPRRHRTADRSRWCWWSSRSTSPRHWWERLLYNQTRPACARRCWAGPTPWSPTSPTGARTSQQV